MLSFFLIIFVYVLSFLLFLLEKFLPTARHHDCCFKTSGNEQTKNHDLQKEKKVGFLSKTGLVDESSEPEHNKRVTFQELSNESSGSPKTVVEDGKSYEIVDSTMKSTCIEHKGVVAAVNECQESLIDESRECASFRKAEINLAKEEAAASNNDEIEVSKGEVNDQTEILKMLLEEEDDWEGIERSELESRFGSAVAYVGSKDNVDKISTLSSDLKLQLYGLHKIAIEGPCHAPQPMAFKVSARAKWNAWQKLGNMSVEVAMKQYINLLSTSIPGWTKDEFGEVNKQDIADAEESRRPDSDSKTNSGNQLGPLDERKSEEVIHRIKGLDAGPHSLREGSLASKIKLLPMGLSIKLIPKIKARAMINILTPIVFVRASSGTLHLPSN